MDREASSRKPHRPEPGQQGTPRVARPACAGDLPAVQSIFKEADLALSGATTETARDAGRNFFVVEVGGQLVAAIHWRTIVPEAEILDIAVRADHRRCGHAAFLLQEFLRHARATGVRKMFLEVRESNVAALALYRKFNFVLTGRRKNYYRNPREAALLLHLVLSG